MTTIACDGKSMAGDSLMCARNEFVGYATKVHRTADGRIFGASGPSADCVRFAEWMHGGDAPDLSDDFSALILIPDGRLFYVCNKLKPVEFIIPNAIGSGADFAIGAMIAGKSSEAAVAIAAERDRGTGGNITIERVSPQMAAVA